MVPLYWFVVFLGGLAALLAFARQRSARNLFPAAAPSAALTLESEACALIVADARRVAHEACDAHDPDEAIRVLRIACSILEDATRDRLDRLRVVSGLSRELRIMSVPDDLHPTGFGMRPLAAIAAFDRVAQAVAVSPAERFALRVVALATGLRFTRWSIRRRERRAAANPRAALLAQLEQALQDWTALDREHVRSLAVLAEPRG